MGARPPVTQRSAEGGVVQNQFIGFAGGVDSFSHQLAMRPDQFRWAENVSFQGGFPQTRPGYKSRFEFDTTTEVIDEPIPPTPPPDPNPPPAPVLFFNVEQTYTATCAFPIVCDPVTVTIAAGTFSSLDSQADADAQALALATQEANDARVPRGTSQTWSIANANTPDNIASSFISINWEAGTLTWSYDMTTSSSHQFYGAGWIYQTPSDGGGFIGPIAFDVAAYPTISIHADGSFALPSGGWILIGVRVQHAGDNAVVVYSGEIYWQAP